MSSSILFALIGWRSSSRGVGCCYIAVQWTGEERFEQGGGIERRERRERRKEEEEGGVSEWAVSSLSLEEEDRKVAGREGRGGEETSETRREWGRRVDERLGGEFAATDRRYCHAFGGDCRKGSTAGDA
ncbi:hypothetical protein AXG93_1333s1030 [Marchantia polymorpha subsp. ruderalis]|uniref:Uncharacterized protein n=1 Tax=Marchantia polymorpha subsp. ruderalis TaxID=1480154 RepID=A0A176WQN5_MARPO|nr:hypothetical protein AXG93_1333s1030 [Marchantia polymorpha subsp. ruderalis]